MHYIPQETWMQLSFLSVTVITFGIWPLLRSLNGAPVRLFGRLNILAQFSMACVYALIFEGQHRIYKTFATFDTRVLFVIIGGYCLGHGDQLTAIPSNYLQPGITTAVSAVETMVLTCIFNYVQVGATHPEFVFSGLGCALVALVFLSQTVKKSRRKESMREGPKWKKYHSFNSGEPLLITPVNICNEATVGFSEDGGVVVSEDQTEGCSINSSTVRASSNTDATISKPKGLAILAIAGIFTACWGPMSTYARDGSPDELVRSPGLMVFCFTLGEVIALPDLYLICTYLEPQPQYILTWRRLFWGVSNGVSIITGYFFFFSATDYQLKKIVVPATVIVNCSLLVSVLIDIVRGEFVGAGLKSHILLSLSVILYLAAVMLNAFSAAF